MKNISILALLFALIVAFAGCGKEDSPEGSTSTPGSGTPSTPSTPSPDPDDPLAGIPANITLRSTLATGVQLSQGGETQISATVRDANGDLVPDGTVVNFIADKGTISTEGTTANGVAVVTFQAGSSAGIATINATTDGNGGALIQKSTTVSIANGPGTSIVTKSVQPQTIGIRGSGIEDTAMITFEVRDSAGNPAEDGTTVDFSLSTSVNGGEQLSAAQAVTAGGVVAVALQSGTVPGTVAVRATVSGDNGTLITEARVTIVSNRPDAGRITMGATTLNLAGGVTLGLQSEVSAYIADRSGNVVPDGWPVSFIAECGSIGTSGGFETSTDLGVATATFQTSAPEPASLRGLAPQGDPGYCRLVAYTPGKGAYQDLNGDGTYDPAVDVCTSVMDEPYIDANDSGDFEAGEYYVDVNGNGQFDRDVVDCVDDSMIWTSMNLMISDYAQPLSIAPSSFNLSLGESEVFTLNLEDRLGNALVAGTKIQISADGGNIVGLSEYEMPDTVGPGIPFSFQLASDQVPTDPTATPPEPKFVTVTATLEPAPGENNNGAGFFDVATGMINLPIPEPASLSVIVNSDLSAGTLLNQGQTSEISALLRYSDGTLATDGTTVTFAASGGTLNPSTATTTNGVATTTFTAPNIGGPVNIKASTQGGEGSTTINVANGDATTIVVDSINPQEIGVRGAGQADSTIITFNVFDQNGNPAPDGTDVNFTLSSITGGGERLSGTSGQLFDGQVSVTLQSGVRAGTAAITASIIDPQGITISTVARVIINAGLPDAKHFSLSALPLNLPGYTWSGETSEIRAYIADRYSNPVPVGTPIYFESEAGAMVLDNVATDVNGQATATHVTQDPRPVTVSTATGREGVSTILAWTSGAESFVDDNGNGQYDPGESFQDIGEPFIDANDNGSYDSATDVYNEERYVDVNGNGSYDPPNGVWNGENYIWTTIDILWSYSDQADIVFDLKPQDPTDTANCAASPPLIPAGGACGFELTVTDANGNPIMGDTAISLQKHFVNQQVEPPFTLSDGGFTIPDTIQDGQNRTTFEFNVTNQNETSTIYPTAFIIQVSGDKGLDKTTNFAITLE